MAVSITLSIRLGPLVTLKVTGQSCHELAQALEGHEDLNRSINVMCGDLADRIYPEGMDLEALRKDALHDENGENEEDQDEDGNPEREEA